MGKSKPTTEAQRITEAAQRGKDGSIREVAKAKKHPIEAGAVPAEKLQRPFPRLTLPIRPPFPPMEAKSVREIPAGENWIYEPKWDGFRCLAFRSGKTLA